MVACGEKNSPKWLVSSLLLLLLNWTATFSFIIYIFMNTTFLSHRHKAVYMFLGSRNGLEQELRKERGRRGSQHSDNLLGKPPPNRDMRHQVEDMRKVTLHFQKRWHFVNNNYFCLINRLIGLGAGSSQERE